MRRLIAIGAVALLVLAAVPLTSAGATSVTKHVDGTVSIWEPGKDSNDPIWMARFIAFSAVFFTSSSSPR